MREQTNLTRYVLAALGVVAISSLACTSQTTGDLGNLEFYYVADDEVGNFNKPIAVGAKLDLFVRDAGAGGDRDVSLEAASTDDEGIAKISEFSGNKMIIEAVSDGSFEITVSAKVNSSGEVEEDKVDMLVRTPEVLELRHTCGESGGNKGYYLAGSDIYIPFELRLEDGQNVIGYGVYPMENTEGLTRDESHVGSQYVKYQAADAPGTTTISSTIDETTLDVELIEAGSIDGMVLGADEDIDLKLDQGNLRYVLPTIGGSPVCQARTEFKAISNNPENCSVKVVLEPGDFANVDYTGSGWLEIEGLAKGDCAVSVSIPAANGGEGVTQEFNFEVDE